MIAACMFAGTTTGWSQNSADSGDDDAPVFELSPFEVAANDDNSYTGSSTLAGNRLNTDIRDIGNAVTVVTEQLLKDIGATDNTTLLQYTPSTEVGGIYGNYAGLGDGGTLDESGTFGNPNQNTRVRGLTAADNTRDFFLTDVPWDGYNIGGVDLQRGPNSILFGQGKPAGIINARSDAAVFDNETEIVGRYGIYGSMRGSINTNHELLPDELALRVAGLYDHHKYQQEPAYRRQKRIYGALRYEPDFLKIGHARTILKANIEGGEIDANHPRSLPPYDRITPWFQEGTYTGHLDDGTPRTFEYPNQETYEAFQLADRSGRRPGRGNAYEVLDGFGPYAGLNDAYNPWLGPWRLENPVVNFNHNSGESIGALVWEPRLGYGLNEEGEVDHTIAGVPFDRPMSIASYQTFAQQARLPYYEWGIHKNKSLADPTVFDFYNNMLDGPNKGEWDDFRIYNVSLSQTFFHDRIGVDATYNRENLTRRTSNLIHQELLVDVMSQTPDREANPNVGRPFVYGMYGNNTENRSERESTRFTAFATHDFTREGGDGWLMRLLGRHTITGLLASDEHNVDSRRFQRYGMDDDYIEFLNWPEGNTDLKFNSARLNPAPVIYLGSSLMGSNSAAGAGIPRPMANHTLESRPIRVFDSTWNAPNVDPADPWIETTLIGTPEMPLTSTQSENPANYVGWTEMPFTILDAFSSDEERDRLTTSAQLTRRTVDSKALVWQGHLWDGAIVGTVGWREDESESYGISRNVNSESSDVYGHLNLSPDSYRLPDEADNRLKVESTAWTVVAHLNRLPYLDRLLERAPVEVSLYYNDSSNFEALSQRVNFLGEEIGPPSGTTIDQGIRIETKNGRFSMRVNKYETRVEDASSTALAGGYAIGSEIALATMWARRFEYALLGYTLADAPVGYENPYDHPSWSSFRYQPRAGQTQEEADVEMHAAIDALKGWIDTVDSRYFDAWGYDPYDLNTRPIATTPLGLAITEDSVSEGYEIEFSAVPLPNWRLTVNASQTEARRTNIGGAELIEFMNSYEELLATTPAGDLRVWWGSPTAETAQVRWNRAIGAEWAQRKLQEGTNVPELREWRVNAISNYSFTKGRLKGVNVGGAVRYQSSVIIGYQPIDADEDAFINFDIDNPYKGPAETNYDFWIGYGRKLSDRLDWRIQLNVRNAFQGDDELIPITVQPDGSPAAFRIAPKRTWEITNTLTF